MQFCDLTFESPADNLACDEALLNLAEDGHAGEILRVWEPSTYFVVLGYGNKASLETNLEFCQRHRIPIFRRCTGGGAVLQGPGVLNYSLILSADKNGPCNSITATNRFVMQRHQDALAPLIGAKVEISGHTDLAIGSLKFSGNAQRRKRRFLIFHGSFLLGLDLSIVEKSLPFPSHQPDYRRGRSHADFLMNLTIPPSRLKSALKQTWRAFEPFLAVAQDQISKLVREKYSRDEWNLKF